MPDRSHEKDDSMPEEAKDTFPEAFKKARGTVDPDIDLGVDDPSPDEEAFLDLLAADINAGAAKPLDPTLAVLMKELTADVEVDLDERIEGDVAI